MRTAMFSRNRDHYQKNALDGFHSIIRTYNQMNECTTKVEGDRLWAELTRGITLFRRTLSKLESRAYENISKKFSGPIGTSEGSATPEESTDSEGDISKTAKKVQTTVPLSEVEWNLDEVMGDVTQKAVSPNEQVVAVPIEPVVDKVEKKAPVVVEEEEEDDIEEDSFDLVPNGPWKEEDSHKEWTYVIRDIAPRLPLLIRFRANDTFPAKVVYVVSPLEFYVVKQSHLKRLEEVDSMLDSCSENLKRQLLVDEMCVVHNACLVELGTKLYRAIIRMAGKKEIQVYLADYGRAHFVPRSDCFSLPRCIANMAPPLAHYCSVVDADSRKLDQASVKAFQEKIFGPAPILIKALGETRRTHGELVDILRILPNPQNMGVPEGKTVSKAVHSPSDQTIPEIPSNTKDTQLASLWMATESASPTPSSVSPSDSVSVNRAPIVPSPPKSPYAMYSSSFWQSESITSAGDFLGMKTISMKSRNLTWWNAAKG